MTYEDYIAQQQQALEEEQSDDCCFLTNQPEGQFVRGIKTYLFGKNFVYRLLIVGIFVPLFAYIKTCL